MSGKILKVETWQKPPYSCQWEVTIQKDFRIRSILLSHAPRIKASLRSTFLVIFLAHSNNVIKLIIWSHYWNVLEIAYYVITIASARTFRILSLLERLCIDSQKFAGILMFQAVLNAPNLTRKPGLQNPGPRTQPLETHPHSSLP